MWYSVLADIVVALHLAYVSYVIVGQALIVAGWALGWSWVRNLWFRVTHLASILVVAIESIFQIECPMTVWERDLAALAQAEVDERSFIGRILGDILFYEDVPADHPGFLIAYLGFAFLVLLTFALVPPRIEGYRKTTVGAIVIGLVGLLFLLFIDPWWLGLSIGGAGVLCWALGRKLEPDTTIERHSTAEARS